MKALSIYFRYHDQLGIIQIPPHIPITFPKQAHMH